MPANSAATPATPAQQVPAAPRPAAAAPRPEPVAQPVAPAAQPPVPAYQPSAPVLVPAPVYQQQGQPAPGSAYTQPSPNAPPPAYVPPDQPQAKPISASEDKGGTTRESIAVSLIAGPMFGTTLGGDNHPEVKTGTTGMVRLALDGYLIPQFSMGTYLLYTSLSPEQGSESADLWAFGGTFKGCFGRANTFQFRPGLAMAYQYEKPSFSGVSSAKGFGIAVVGDVAFPIGQGGLMGLFQLSFVSQPAGGGDGYGLTFPPAIYLAGGLEFGK